MRPKKLILCVDDNEQDLSVLTFMLSTHGYRILAATSAEQAIKLFADHLIDLVIADAVMPQMTGDQLIRRLKQLAAHVPMVLMGDPAKCNIYAADGFVSKKTCTPMELLEVIKVKSARKRGPRKGHLQATVLVPVVA
jgi:two-component system response regulator CpxR